MLGAIIGDIVGSIYEFDNLKSKKFAFFQPGMFFTDDSIMTVAVAKALLECNEDYSNLAEKTVYWMQTLGNRYPHASYGYRFNQWLKSDCPRPYNSWGNGSAMRVSPVAYVAKSIDEVIMLSKIVTEVTHNHPEGIKGAEATAVATYMALHGSTKVAIKEVMSSYYDIDFSLDDIREIYEFNESCQGTLPVALVAFFESQDFEDAIRNAISVGGDSDTIAAITGAIAGAYYGIPAEVKKLALDYLDDDLREVVTNFEDKYPEKMDIEDTRYCKNKEDLNLFVE